MAGDDKKSMSILAGHESSSESSVRRFFGFREGNRWKLVVLALGLAAALIVALLLLKKKPAGEEAEAVVVSVKVEKVERGSIAAEVTVLGTIFGRKEATVSSKIAGQIKTMALVRNKPVREGEVIATLEARDVLAQRAEAAASLEEARSNLRNVTGGSIPQTAAQDEKAVRDARANVSNARAVYERRLVLYEQGGISKKDVEASQLTLTTAENDLRLAEATQRLHAVTMSPSDRRVAESKLKQAEDRLSNLDAQLGYAVIRAPFTGVITEQFQFQGEFAQPGAKLFAIDDVSEVIVKAPVADTVAAQLKVGDTAKVLPQDLPGEEMVGVISLVSRASDPQSRSVEIWVKLKNEGGRLRADSAAKVVVATQTANDVVIVPASAVTLEATNANEGSVMVVDEESVAHETKVAVGVRTPEKMEITSGLKGGETIVVEGNYALPDGTKVEVAKEEEEKSPEKKGD